jgi:hypothetical protein
MATDVGSSLDASSLRAGLTAPCGTTRRHDAEDLDLKGSPPNSLPSVGTHKMFTKVFVRAFYLCFKYYAFILRYIFRWLITCLPSTHKIEV